MTTVFLRALEAADKPATLLAAIRDPKAARGRTRFEVDAAAFSALPGTPIAYWTSSQLRAVFREYPPFATGANTVKQGLASGDDYRFMRLWWEVDSALTGVGKAWVTVSKGGDSRPYYADLPLVLGYSRGEQLAIQQIGRFGRGATHYYLPGLTYSLRASRFAPQVLPAGAITTVRGSGIYAYPSPGPFLAVLNARVVDYLLKLMLGRGGHPQFDMGDIAQLPVPQIPGAKQKTLASIGARAWSIRRTFDTRIETSHAFALPALLQVSAPTLADRAAAWADRVRAADDELAAIQAEIDERCFDLYGIDEADRRVITAGFGDSGIGAESDAEADEAASGDAAGEDDEEAEAAGAADAPTLAADLLSWAVGVAFGRFDLRLATGERQPPPEPDPFDPLPVCSPGMLTGDDGLPLAAPPPGYSLEFPADGVLVDDPGHASDLMARAREVFGVVFGDDADARWQEAAELVVPRDHDLRRWLAREFFALHLRAYSKSRRRAPIYWQLGTASGSYSVWLYYHRFTRDTLFTVLNDDVTPKLRHEERRLTGLVQEVGPHPTPGQRRDIAAQEAFVEELRAFREELARVAPLWDPDLSDGVILNFAPLWRLIPQHKAWQREVKAAWDKLATGAYDWAHLAMHLRPERVVPKCATDRSLAISHGLEDVYWVEGDDGKWRQRDVSVDTVRELVMERSSEAVKAARDSLPNAQTANGTSIPRRTKGNAQ